MGLMRAVLSSMSHISSSQRVRKVLDAKKVILREFLVRFCLFERQHAGAINAGANSLEVLPPNAFKKNVNDKTLLNGLTVAGKTV
jgi:hypothetical protein